MGGVIGATNSWGGSRWGYCAEAMVSSRLNVITLVELLAMPAKPLLHPLKVGVLLPTSIPGATPPP